MRKVKNKPETEALRVLILEDNRADAELVERELQHARINFTSLLVEGKREYNKALTDFQPQVILSDFKLPRFDGLAALEMARRQAPEVPFIFVSGSIGEEKAIETLTLGASDYIFKDNLQRLGPAVKRVLENVYLKLEKKEADKELQGHVEELRLLAEAADFFVQANDLDKIYDYLAKVIREISGADYLLLSVYDEALQAVRPNKIIGGEMYYETIRRLFHIDPKQMVFYLKDMRPDDFNDFVSRRLLPVRDGLYGLANGKIPRQLCRTIEKLLAVKTMFSMGFSWENQLYGGMTVLFRKGNELKNPAQVETLLNQAAVSIKRLLAEHALLESEIKYRTLVSQSPDGIFIADLQGNFLSVNQAMCDTLKYSEEEFLFLKIWDIVPEQYMNLYKKRLAAIMKGEAKNEAAEYMVSGKDGEIQYIDIISAPYYKNNELIGFQGIARNTTEKKKMEIRLRESEEYYRTLVDTSPDAIVIVDAGGRVTFASQKVIEIFGLPERTSISGISIMDFVEPAEVSKVQERMVEILSGRSLPEIREYRLQRHDHRPFWAEVSSAPLRDAGGRSIGLLLICRDVSERKLAETEILRQKAFLEKLVESAPEGIAITDCPGRVLKVNSEFVNIFGFTADDAVGKMIDDLLAPPGYREEAGKLTKDSGEGKKVVLETVRKRKDGSRLSVSIIGAPVFIAKQQVAVYAIYRDISERKRAEEELRLSAEKWQSTFNSITDIVTMISADHTFLEINQAGCAALGLERKDILGKKCFELVHNLHRPVDGCPCTLTMQTKKMEESEIFENGRYYRLTAWPILDGQGELVAFSHSIRDITESRLAKEQIQYQANLLQKVSDAIIATDRDNTIKAWNPAAERIYGWKSAEVIGSNLHDLLHPEYQFQNREEVIGKLDREGSWSGEVIHHLKGGKQIPVHSAITILKDSEGNRAGMVSVNHDISERKQAEELIRASLKEKEVLLQEIHHRVKNNLQIISGLLTLQADQSAGKSLDEIFQESQDRIRSIALIHEKLYRSRNLAEIAFDEYLRALVDNLCLSYGVAAGRITIKYALESILFTIEKAIPLGLIVNELVTNILKHAFPDGRQGEIRISLHGYKGAKSYALKTESGTLHIVPTCELIVADNGVGLPADQIPEQQKSLGMNLVSMLARQIKAELKIKTGPGAEFCFLFPGLPENQDNKKNNHGD